MVRWLKISWNVLKKFTFYFFHDSQAKFNAFPQTRICFFNFKTETLLEINLEYCLFEPYCIFFSLGYILATKFFLYFSNLR